MDKETLSNYGWIVICVLVLAVMIALATPFGSFVSEAVQSTTQGLFDVNQGALDAAGIEIMQQEFEETLNGGTGGSDNAGDQGDTGESGETETTVYSVNGNIELDGTALSDVVLTLQRNGTNLQTVTTDSTGAFMFSDLQVGTYDLEVTYNNNTWTESLTVEEGGTFSFTFEVPIESTTTIITFTIAGIEYRAEEGMTWDAWEKSEYYDDEKFSRIAYGTTDTLLSYDYEAMKEVVVSNPNGSYILIEETITNGTQYLLIKNDGSTD